MAGKFKSPKIKCKDCGEVIYSKWGGHFATCKCWRTSHTFVQELQDKIVQDEGLTDANEIHQLGCMLMDKHGTGVFIDHTDYYTRHGGNGEFLEEDDNHDK